VIAKAGNMKLFKPKILIVCMLTLAGISFTPVVEPYHSKTFNTLSNEPLFLTVSTSKSSYSLRDLVAIQGTLKEGVSPVSDGLVGVEVRSSQTSPQPVAFRTVPTGDVSAFSWPVNFLAFYPSDLNGDPKYSFNIMQALYVKGEVKNSDVRPHMISVTVSIYDGNNIPLAAALPILDLTLGAGDTASFFSMTTLRIPEWAYPGNATIYGCIFSRFPQDNGTPFCPEKAVSFEIKRNPLLTYRSAPQSFPPTPDGTYFNAFKLSPESKNGTYTIYASATKASNRTLLVENATTFLTQYIESPPQASFFYTPTDAYVDVTITFDASSSSAEGYGDTIVSYEWDFNDPLGPNPPLQTQPTYNHIFKQVGTYIVMLNVTDSEGLWCITAKPVTIRPPITPKANFTWSPPVPGVNRQVSFDSSGTELGWNGTDYSPIVRHIWDFGDGNITTVNGSGGVVISHIYTTDGNFTVKLTVRDSEGLDDDVSAIVTVAPVSQVPGDINNDSVVNFLDAILLGTAFSSQPGDGNWDSRCDLNGDGIINFLDGIILGLNFGHTS
jgi:PKD repeat protein